MSLILYCNIQGFLNKKDEISYLLNKQKPMLLCMTETHITDVVDDQELYIDFYDLLNCKSHSSHTGGSIIYIRNDIKYIPLENIIINNNLWITGCTLILPGNHIDLYVLYRSPSSSDAAFLYFLNQFFSDITIKGKKVLLIGDFNINMLNISYYSNEVNNMCN